MVPAVLVSSKEIRCITTPSMPGQISVSVANNGVPRTTESTQFSVFTPALIQTIEPRNVDTQGGSVVSVIMKGLADGTNAQCLFGNMVYVTAESAASGTIQCVSPAAMPGHTTIQVSTNHQDFTSRTQLLHIIHASNVTSVTPNIVSAHGSTVSVAVNPSEVLSHIVDISCFVTDKTFAAVTAPGQAECRLPGLGAGMHAVEVAPTQAVTHSGIQVEAIVNPVVSSVSPTSGQMMGGTVITLMGSGFIASKTSCMFGEHSVIEANVVSSSLALCIAPKHVIPGAVLVGVSISESVSSNTNQFVYTNALVPTMMEPTTGSSQGGTVVLVSVQGLLVSASAWTSTYCRFNQQTVVRALSVEDGMVKCKLPAGSAGYSMVQVSFDGLDYVVNAASLTFKYVDLANVTAVVPSTMAIMTRTEITLSLTDGMSPSHCASMAGSTWSFSSALTTTAGTHCVITGHADGMKIIDISVGTTSEVVSYSGVQVEFSKQPLLNAVAPPSGSVDGGTVATAQGEPHTGLRRVETPHLPGVGTVQGSTHCPLPPAGLGLFHATPGSPACTPGAGSSHWWSWARSAPPATARRGTVSGAQ